jgi:hypothetical protein
MFIEYTKNDFAPIAVYINLVIEVNLELIILILIRLPDLLLIDYGYSR